MSAIRNGWQAERFVQDLLEKQAGPDDLVIPLSPSFAADLLVLAPETIAGPLWVFVEVKSARDRWHALNAKLSAPEAALREKLGDRYRVFRVLTYPDGRCELLKEE